jgi:hypothetical protein
MRSLRKGCIRRVTGRQWKPSACLFLATRPSILSIALHPWLMKGKEDLGNEADAWCSAGYKAIYVQAAPHTSSIDVW